MIPFDSLTNDLDKFFSATIFAKLVRSSIPGIRLTFEVLILPGRVTFFADQLQTDLAASKLHPQVIHLRHREA